MDLSKLDALVAGATRPEAEVPLCLDGALNLEWERLEKELVELSRRQVTLADSGKSDVTARMEALQERMAESTVTVRLRALPKKDFRKIAEEHPPRQGHHGDAAWGFNQETLYDALIAACLVEPELDEARLSALLEALTDKQYTDLSQKAWDINRSEVSVPLPFTASLIAQSSGGTSRLRSESGSASVGGSGGNRKKSPSTSTKKGG